MTVQYWNPRAMIDEIRRIARLEDLIQFQKPFDVHTPPERSSRNASRSSTVSR